MSVCYEDSDAIAFMDVQPVNGGHVLVVPRDHYESLCDVPPAIAMHLFEVSMRLAPIIRDVSGCGDMNLVVNSGEAAGQNVFHYHVHLIPRRKDDGFDIPLPFSGLGDAGPHVPRCHGRANHCGASRSGAPARNARRGELTRAA